MRDLICIRSHKIARPENDLYDSLRMAFPAEAVVFCLDESRGVIDTGGRPKMSLTADVAERLAGQPLPEDWGWRMGDLCFALAAESYPAVERFWLIEGDVFVPKARAAGIFERLRGVAGAYVTPGFQNKGRHRMNRALEGILDETSWGSLCFALVRADQAMVDAAIRLRRTVGTAYASRHRKPPAPNDEAIYANAAVAGGFEVGDFMADCPDILSPDWFNVNPPFLYEHVLETEGSGTRILTPVLEFEHLLRRVQAPGVAEGRKHAYPRWRLRRILPVLSEEQRVRLDKALSDAGDQTPSAD